MSEKSAEEGSARVATGTRQWLSSGRVQASSGAYCAWRDIANDNLAFEYPEITGYALTWLSWCDGLDARELQAGRRAADWLMDRLSSGDRSARADWDGGAIYTFDLGMIAAGLISFGARIKHEDYAERGREVVRSLVAYLDERQRLDAIAPDGPASSRSGGWSTDGRPHLVKCVQALLLADQPDAARCLLRQAIDDQDPDDGHFVTQPGDEFVMLHPHLYGVEGMWMWGSARDDQDALERARRAIDWAWQHQLPSGGMPRWVSGSDTGPEQLDVTSQAVRAAVILGLDPPGLEAATLRIAALARADGEHGYALIYRPEDVSGHLNAWVSMFAGQALAVASEGPYALSWNALV